MDIKEVISIDKDILGGQPVFKGTRVPIDTLFSHLEKGISINEFLEDFPSVNREQTRAVIDLAGKILTSKNIEKLIEAAA